MPHGIVHFLPEDGPCVALAVFGPHVDAARLGCGDENLVLGAGDGDVCQSPFVFMQAPTVFFALGEEQLVFIDGIHAVNRQIAACSVFLVRQGERVFEFTESFGWVSALDGVVREARQNIRIGANRCGHHIGTGQPCVGFFRVFRRLPLPCCVR